MIFEGFLSSLFFVYYNNDFMYCSICNFMLWGFSLIISFHRELFSSILAINTFFTDTVFGNYVALIYNSLVYFYRSLFIELLPTLRIFNFLRKRRFWKFQEGRKRKIVWKVHRKRRSTSKTWHPHMRHLRDSSLCIWTMTPRGTVDQELKL